MRQARKSLAHVPSTDIGGDKENLTVDSAALSSMTAPGKQATKKSRSKSIGPGGLDALKEGTGNKQEVGFSIAIYEVRAEYMQLAVTPQVKSILKPTIPLSPPKAIPPHKGEQKASPGKASASRTPEKSPAKSSVDQSSGLPNPFEGSPTRAGPKSYSPNRSPARVALRTEEEQQAAAKERERQELLAHKDARRKSLGTLMRGSSRYRR